MGLENRLVFKAVPSNGTCFGCAFERGFCSDKLFACAPEERSDAQHVIWVIEEEDDNARAD